MRSIRRIRKYLQYDGLKILVNTLIISLLDFCNSLYIASLSIKYEFRILQRVLWWALSKDGKAFFMQTRNAFLVIGLTVLIQELLPVIPQAAQ